MKVNKEKLQAANEEVEQEILRKKLEMQEKLNKLALDKENLEDQKKTAMLYKNQIAEEQKKMNKAKNDLKRNEGVKKDN